MGRKKSIASQMNVVEKQETALARTLDNLIVDSNDLKQYLGVSSQAINQYRLGISRPSLENLCKIADYYGVTTDYLLGRSEIKTAKEDVIVAAKTTGLTESAILSLQEAQKDFRKSFFSLPELNRLLRSDTFWEMILRFAIYRIECNSTVHRPKAIISAKESGDFDTVKRAGSDYKFAVEDKQLALFEAQKLLFEIAGNIDMEVSKNAVDPGKTD